MNAKQLTNTKTIKLVDVAIELSRLEQAINDLADRLFWIERGAEAESQVHYQAQFLRKMYVADMTERKCNIISYIQAQEKILDNMKKRGLE